MIYQEEKDPVPVFKLIQDILQDHMEEVNKCFKVEKIEPSWHVYQKLHELSRLLVVTARGVDNEVLGDSITILAKHMHYNFTIGHNDIIYMLPEHRGHGRGLIKYTEKCLKERNIEYFSLAIKPHVDYRPLIERMGYEFLEYQYVRRLK